jgi:hypothetical protein
MLKMNDTGDGDDCVVLIESSADSKKTPTFENLPFRFRSLA